MPDIKEALSTAIESSGSPPPDLEPIATEEPYRDEYSADLDSQESAPTSEPNASHDQGPLRDEKGRFLSKSVQESAPEKTLTEEVTQSSETSHVENQSPEEPVQMPSGFGKHKDLWQKLTDPNTPFTFEDKQEVLAFYKARENEMLKGLGEAREIAHKSHYLAKSIEHLLPDLQREGIDPGVMFKNLAQAHLILKNGSPQEKINTLQYLAQQYGVQFDTNSGQMAPMDPLTQQMMDQLRGVQSKLSNFEQERLQNQLMSIQSEVEALESDATNFPLFNEARQTMARLLESGQAQTFQEAYRKAIRLDDELWEKEQSRKLALTKPQPIPNQSHIEKAKAAAVSVRSEPPSGRVNPATPRSSQATNERNSIRDALTRAFG